ncbi:MULTISPECIES: alkaline phosphatase PhoX [unclassified Roseateles]|uniref:alkaline phosphatase PhoX n=1 Tax=unclassified Roseateles TaxID=2626991 RepID=UPI00138F8F3D|nr:MULTISPECIES: alkaline phosphatase PhoX [unclassified Roseateles]
MSALSPVGEALARVVGARRAGDGYGPLRPVPDANTGLPLLQLPEGFSYRSFAWAGELLADGSRMPGAADGMGIARADGEVFTLVRNHEVMGPTPFGPAASHYDPACGGGTVTLRYDRRQGKLAEARGSLSGTLVNCAGGITPWGSWLSCEEIVTPVGHSGQFGGKPFRLEHAHGFVFEVPADGVSSAKALTSLGQFKHEAALVDPRDGVVYLTEDHRPAGFYRLLPTRKGDLAAGGRLQMLRAKGASDLRRGLKPGQRFDIDWVDIEQPAQGFVGGAVDGVQRQGLVQGASRFTRLEGLIAGDDEIFFNSTDGGDAQAGQVWRLIPSRQQLELFFESPGAHVLDYPDNVTLAPGGGLLICEDSKQPVQRLWWMGRDGQLAELARNNTVLDGEHLGIKGDFRNTEWAGACFSADGKTLFANIYRPGYTVAISGPF